MKIPLAFSRAAAFTGVSFLSIGIAHAQYFDFSSAFSPNPVLSTVSGNMITVTNDFNNSGVFAGAFGSDIVVANFAATATSATTGSWNTPITELVTLSATDSAGVLLPGTAPVTHSFTLNYNGDVDSNAVTSSMGILPTSNILYSFANGENFTLHLTSYTGPSAPDGTGTGSLGGHVTGSLGGVPNTTPEPGSFALFLGMATTGAGFLGRRRKNARKVA